MNLCRKTSSNPPACEICGCASHSPLWSLHFDGYPGAFKLWRCGDCGLVFNWPRLSPDEIRAMYNGDYYVFSSPPQRRWSRATHLYATLLLPLESRAPHGRLLEVGSARGELLALAAERGWQVQGVELSTEAAGLATADYGVPVKVGTLEEHRDMLGSFDVVIATDVIEHVLSPRAFLNDVQSTVIPGGYVIIQTPNWGSAWRKFGRRRWLGINQFHIFLFNAMCLQRLMRQCGLDTYKAYSVANPSCVQWSCRSELAALKESLPKALQWRAEYWLNRLTPQSLATQLHRDPPANLEQALTRIECLAQNNMTAVTTGRLNGDNLVVVGQISPEVTGELSIIEKDYVAC